MSEVVRVAVDAMGGDNAPGEIIKGAVCALKANENLDLTLVGKEELVNEELSKYPDVPKERCRVLNATEIIEMAEPPVAAITKKKDSSIVKGMKLVHEGRVSYSTAAPTWTPSPRCSCSSPRWVPSTWSASSA